MGRIIISLIVILSLLSSCAVGKKVNDKMKDEELMRVLALSNFIDLNKIDTGFEKDLLLRVFEVPVMKKNDCFPESHGVCAYDYYLSVSQFDENPEYNVFKIGRFGQIVSFTWIEEDKPGYAEIELLTHAYSSAALKYNQNLKTDEKRVLLKIDINGVRQD